MSNRLKAEPGHVRLVTAQIMRFMADTLEREGASHLSVEDMRLIAAGLETANVRKHTPTRP